jgi:3-dehydroquinate dehydratase/shikimate dehydrogenase
MVYEPEETRLLKLAAARGAQTIRGAEMFVHQAARQFEIWTGKPAPWDDMLRVMNTVFSQRAADKNGGRENNHQKSA